MAYSYVRYTGNGTTANYTFPFQYISSDHIKVKVDGVAPVFTFLNANTVTIYPSPAEGSVVEIKRVTPKDTPVVNFTDGSVLLERDLDLLATFDLYISQEAADAVENTISVDSTGRWDGQGKRLGNIASALNDDEAVTKGTLDYEYPAVVSVAGVRADISVVAADLGVAATLPTDLGSITDPVDSSTPSGSSNIVTVATNIASVNSVAANMTAIQGANTAATNAAASATAAAGSASSAASSASAASVYKTAAASSATSAATSATSATGSAATATTRATDAATSATSAASSASTATTQATNAASSASAAATSATNAAASAASAAALLDNFDDRYLGPKSSAPLLDNDGNSLVVGALYFDTTTAKMRVYTATGWVDASSAAVAALTVYRYTATAGQTTFSGADSNLLTLAYMTGGIVVSLNGSVLVGAGNDYTASNGTSVVLTTGASAGDILEVYAFASFSIASVNGSAITDNSVTVDKLTDTFDLGVLP